MSKNWAICIGINDYYNLKPLQYAVQDADSIRDFCVDEAGFETLYFFAKDAEPIQGDRGFLRADPTIGNLERFLRVRFEQPFLEPGDNLWFFFAGHGKRVNGCDYLMPIDGDPDNVGRTGLAIREISDRLRRSGADNVLLFLDACRGDGDRDSSDGIGTEKQQGVITFYSCSPSELAYEIEDIQAGAFTHALLEGLRISGENNCATVERLYQHLRYRVPQLNQRYRKPSQTPYAITEPATKLHLILLPQYATLQDALALKNDALEAEAQGHFDVSENLLIRVLAASPADRQAITALQRIALKRAGQAASPGPTGIETAGTRSVAGPTSPPARTPPPVKPQHRIKRRAYSSPPKLAVPTFEFEVVAVNQQGQITQRKQRHAQYRQENQGNGITLELVLIPGGTFTMGSSSNEENRGTAEGPQHEVTVPQFWMGKYQVTQAQYQTVMGKNPSMYSGNGANRPVELVSWDDAVAFCQKLSQQTGREYRLPSEAEWEYACRADSTTPFHFGPTLTPDLANYNGNYTYGSGPQGRYREQTTEVGSFPANAFGLYDMHGNVWEWCLDHWHDSYNGAPTDGSAWATGGDSSLRVLRGGSWVSDPRYCRSANRLWDARDSRYGNCGFRVVSAASWALS
jgi:formylglycine-generating enzyme required for sulfatase activity/uncharacterized caspase-like protein